MSHNRELNILQKMQLYILKSIGYIVAILPQFIRFGIADINGYILYYLLRYRRKVTRQNLSLSFPNKCINDIIKIEKRYYRHLGDLFLDSLALVGSSKRMVKSHFVYNDADFWSFNQNKPVICAMSHYGSWEYTVGYKMRTENPLFPIYRPLKSEVMDELFYQMRSRFGAEPCSMKNSIRRAIQYRGQNFIMAMIADQTPVRNPDEIWYKFLNQDTQFFMGFGQMAKRFGMGVYFLDVRRIKRGYYYGKMIQIYDGVEDITYNEIVERYIMRLERMIEREPSLWTWSHKRWKHKR